MLFSSAGWAWRGGTILSAHRVIVVASNGVNTCKVEEGGKSIIDPHVWNSMQNGVIYVTNVTSALIKTDPEDTADIRKSDESYIQ